MNRRTFGRVRQLPSARWQARYPGGDGRDRAAPRTFATAFEAEQFLASIAGEMSAGDATPDRHRLLVLLAGWSGLRWGELAASPAPTSTRCTARFRSVKRSSKRKAAPLWDRRNPMPGCVW